MNGDVDMDLGNNERRMLRAMLSDSAREWTLEQLLSETGWEDQVHVAGAGTVSYTHLTLPTIE